MKEEHFTSRYQAIEDFNNEVKKVYRSEGLANIEGFEGDFLIGEVNILDAYLTAIEKGKQKFQEFDFYQAFYDLCFCSTEILYFTANLFLYRPYLFNPEDYKRNFAGMVVYPSYRGMPDIRYDIAFNAATEKVYNYWDRIGDLIASHLPGLLNKGDVYFAKVIDKMPAEFHSSNHYLWLKNYREHHYPELNKMRKNTVHYISHSSSIRWKHLNNLTDQEEVMNIYKTRGAFPEYFKSELERTTSGLIETIGLIQEISKSSH